MKHFILTKFAILSSIITFGQLSPSKFDTPFLTNSGSNTQSIAIGDLNGDGKPDVISTNMGNNNIRVTLNECPKNRLAQSCLGTNFTLSSNATGSPTIPAVGDLNQDGKLDIITGLYGSASTVAIFLNNFSGGSMSAKSFTKTSLTGGLSEPSGVAIGDIDGDGKQDLLVANYTANSIRVYINTTQTPGGTPSFVPASFPTGTNPNSCAIGDVDNDGRPEVICSNWESKSLTIYKNNSSPGALNLSMYGSSANSVTIGTNPYWVRVTDLNNDSLNEIVCSNYTSGTLSIIPSLSKSFLNLGVVRTLNVSYPFAGTQASGIADLDGDEYQDAVVADAINKQYNLFKNLGNPSSIGNDFLTAVGLLNSFGATVGVSVEDLDNDGRAEVIGANFEEGTVSIIKNLNLAPSPITSSTNFSYSVNSTGIWLKFTKGGGKRRLIIGKLQDQVRVIPEDTNWYSANSIFGQGTELGTGNFVVYSGSEDSVLVKNLQPNSTYHFSIFDYNGYLGYSNYKTDTYLSGIVNTSPNSISEQTIKQKQFRIYPNPTNSILKISEKADVFYSVFDLSGKKVREGKASEIDCTDFNKGTYLIHIWNNEFDSFQKLVIKD